MNTYIEQQLIALGEATRREILGRLRSGPMPVGDIARAFPISRPAISQHLRILKGAQLVLDRAEGNRRVYELNPVGLASLRDYFDRLWSEAADASRREVEESDGESWRAW